MTPETLVSLFRFYRHWINEHRGCELRDCGEDASNYAHLAWMCERAETSFVPGDPLDRLQRWLGFVQGVLLCRGDFTMSELWSHVRDAEGERVTSTISVPLGGTAFCLERTIRRNTNRRKFPPIRSAHEGLGLILEEVAELKRGIFRKRTYRKDKDKFRSDLAQVAAMCERVAEDLVPDDKTEGRDEPRRDHSAEGRGEDAV